VAEEKQPKPNEGRVAPLSGEVPGLPQCCSCQHGSTDESEPEVFFCTRPTVRTKRTPAVVDATTGATRTSNPKAAESVLVTSDSTGLPLKKEDHHGEPHVIRS